MGKGDIKKDIVKIVNDKKFLNVVVVFLILAFVLLAISFITNSRKKESAEDTSTKVSSNASSELEKNAEATINSYEENEKAELKKLLSSMNNVGEVDVMIYFKSGEVKVPATEKTTQETVTEETDSQGGKRTNETQNGGSKVVMSGDGSKNEPYILQVNKPEITGVLIVADGASSAKVKYDIQVAVSSLYGISIDKVNVYPKKS